MISDLIFNSDIFSGNILWIDNIQSTGGKVVVNSNLDIRDDLNVGKNTHLSGTIYVDQDAVLKSNLYLEDDLNVGENTQLSGTIHVDQDAVLKSKLYVEDDLNVGENTQLSGTIHVDQDAVFRSGLFVEGNAQINGNLYVSGDRVIMETSTVRVEDKNIELAVLDSATDATADQGGITLKGTTDKTILWSNATDSWDLSENVGVADGKFIFSDKLRARDSAGLSLEDDGGNGIFIEDGGDVGIGTTSPSVGLEINHTDAVKIPKGTTLQRPTSTGATHKGYIRYNTTTDQFEGFGAGNAWGSLGGVVDVDQDTYISAENSAGSDNDQLKFFTIGTQKAVIDSNGNVGIGTTDPEVIHHVSTKDDTTKYAVTRFTANSQQFDIGVGGSNAQVSGLRDKFYIYDSTNNGAVLVINSAGNVGIGTTSPGSKLTVLGQGEFVRNSVNPCILTEQQGSGLSASFMGTEFGDIVKMGTTDGLNNPRMFIGSSATGIYLKQSHTTGAGNFDFQNSGGGSRMYIGENGNVGIGTTSPGAKLDISGNDDATINITAPNNKSSAIHFSDPDADHQGILSYTHTVDAFRFFTQDEERVRIDSAGNVGIGTTNPGERLDVNGRIRIENSTAPTTTTNRLYSVGGILYWDGENVLHARDTIGEMEDTSIGTKSNGQVLIWNATSSKWVNNALTGGNGIDVTNAAGGITISHTDTSSATSSNNSGRTYIQDIGLDTYGHVTSLATRTHSNAAITLTAGSGMSGGGSFDLDQSSAETITISHSDTSSATSSNNSGRTYIQDIGLDTFGHVTSLATRTHSDAAITLAAGSGMSGGGSFGLDQSSAETITISHSDTSSAASSNNSGRTYIQDIGLDAYGHVTSLNTATETVVNTNTTYSAGNGLGLTGTVFSISSDLIGKVHSIGNSASDKISTAVNSISFTAGNALRAKLLSSGTFHVSGDVLAFSSTISDERLKDNATEIKGALNKIETMRGVSYTWNKGSRKGQKDIGVIAQEVEQVIPEIVREYKFEVGEFEGDENEYKTVDYEKLSAVLIEAIKELSAKVKTLEKIVSDTQV
jgi:predicted acyltransferase (DUF342 family)